MIFLHRILILKVRFKPISKACFKVSGNDFSAKLYSQLTLMRKLSAAMMSWVGWRVKFTNRLSATRYMKVKRMEITNILRKIWLFTANKIKSSESFSKKPTRLIVELNSLLQQIIDSLIVLKHPPLCILYTKVREHIFTD